MCVCIRSISSNDHATLIFKMGGSRDRETRVLRKKGDKKDRERMVFATLGLMTFDVLFFFFTFGS